MVKIAGPLLSLEASGDVSKKIIFRKKRRQQIATRYHKPTGIKSADQNTIRVAMKALQIKYNTELTDDMRASWEIYAKQSHKPWAGYHAFLKKNFIKYHGTGIYDHFAPIYFFKDEFPEANGAAPNPANWIITDGPATIQNNQLQIGAYENPAAIKTLQTIPQPLRVEYDLTPTQDGGTFSDLAHYLTTLNAGNVRVIFNHKHSAPSIRDKIRIYHDAGGGDLIAPVANPCLIHGTKYRIKIEILNIEKRIKIFVDDIQKVDYNATAWIFGERQAGLGTYKQVDKIGNYRITLLG